MIEVITSITGGKDRLIDDQVMGNATFTAYLDTPQESKTWNVKPAYNRFTDPRRNSRIHKILSHTYSEADYTIWIDGNLKLLVPPEELIERYLGDHDFAVSKHGTRDCLYDEGAVCAEARIDDPEVIREHLARYERAQFGKHKGLYECGVLLRRNTPKVAAFNSVWWSEYTRGSKRDQISFPYAVDRAGLRINVISEPWYEKNGRYFRSDAIELVNHLTPRT